MAVAGCAAVAALCGCAGGVDSSQAPPPAAPVAAVPVVDAEPERFVGDVSAVTTAMTTVESILTVQSSSAEGIDGIRAHGDALRAQLAVMDAAAARMRGYRVTVAATDVRRRAVLATLPDVTGDGRAMLAAIDHRDGRGAAGAATRFLAARERLVAALSA